MTGIYTRTLFESMEDRTPRITGLYRSPEFCEQARRLADVQEHYFRTCIDRLVDSGIVPHADPDPLVAVAMDMATLLAALSTRSDSAVMLADTQRTLSMPFRFEFGASAMYGPWNHPDGIDETGVQTFGAHLARSIRRRFDARAASEAEYAQVMLLGRAPRIVPRSSAPSNLSSRLAQHRCIRPVRSSIDAMTASYGSRGSNST